MSTKVFVITICACWLVSGRLDGKRWISDKFFMISSSRFAFPRFPLKSVLVQAVLVQVKRKTSDFLIFSCFKLSSSCWVLWGAKQKYNEVSKQNFENMLNFICNHDCSTDINTGKMDRAKVK